MKANIDEMLRLGEDSVCEFKSMRIPGKRVVAPDGKEIADDMASAANAAGATFLFGVNDKTHEVEGIPEEKLAISEAWIRDICNDSVKPPVPAIIRKEMVRDAKGEGRCVLRVDVPKSLFVHEGPHGYFYRIGSAKRKMPPEMLARLFQQRSQTRLVSFDEQVVSRAEARELVPSLYSRFRSELSAADDREFLRKLHFLAPDADGIVRPTVAGVLFATEHPETYLPSAFVQAVCYRGIERNANDQLDARDIIGPLDAQIIEACQFVKRNMRVAAIKNPARIDIPQYAMNAVFEAIVNAVAHRDYSISGAKVRLHMFSDRLEIFSPGGLPNSLTIDEIGERQYSRNELICTCLSRCTLNRRFAEVARTRIMDKRGEGVPVIIAASGKLSGITPEYRILGNSELMLTIYSVPIEDRARLQDLATIRNGTLSSESGTLNGTLSPESGTLSPESGTLNGTLNSTARKVLDFISKNNGCQSGEIIESLAMPRDTLNKVIKRLIEGHLIERRGSKKTGGYYAINRPKLASVQSFQVR